MKLIKNNDIVILLFSLLLFSLGVGWIYSKSIPDKIQHKIEGEKKTVIKKLPEPPKEVVYKSTDVPKVEKNVTIDEILDYIQEFVTTEGITQIIKVLKEECPKDKIIEVMHTVIKKYKDTLSREEKLQVIISSAYQYKDDKKLSFKLFDIIAQNKDLEDGEVPLLFVALHIGERRSIPYLIEWYKQSKRPQARNLAEQTLEYAAKHDYDQAIKKLHETGVKIDKDYATKLLWLVVKSNQGAKSIPFLASLGADLNNSDPKTKYTLLIQAIKNKNLDAVKALIEAGAQATKPSEDKAIGFPLQIARELDQIDIELFLRSKGARD